MATTHRAKQVSANKWLQVVDCFDPPESSDAFKARVAARFGLPEADIAVVATDWAVAQREAAAQEMAAGTHEGLGVVMAPKPPPPIDPNATLKAKIDAALADPLVAQATKDVFVEWKTRL